METRIGGITHSVSGTTTTITNGGTIAGSSGTNHTFPCISSTLKNTGGDYKNMNSEEYSASEFSFDYLDAQADAGDLFLDQTGFQYRLTSAEISELVREGHHWLLIDKILGRANTPTFAPVVARSLLHYQKR
jgi:hypothetical protein